MESVIGALFLLLTVECVLIFLSPQSKKKITQLNTSLQKCSMDTCGALDPVNDPDYNIRETIKNTLLIEDHLANKKKYCKQCICKHMLISIGYLEESIWMAGCTCPKYPKLEESASFYEAVFKKWYNNMDNDNVRLETLVILREWRQQMIELYYFKKT